MDKSRYVDDSRSSLSRSRLDAVARSLTPSLDRSRRHRFIPATPSPRSVNNTSLWIWCSVFIQQIDTAYSDQLNTAYRPSDTVAEANLSHLTFCMTRSSTNELLTPFKEPEQEFQSSRKLFETLSLDESRSPEYNLFSDLEENSEEEVAETMAETMEQYISKTRADYGSGIARPKINDKDHFELKGQFLKELRDNTFSGSDHEDANEHIEKVFEIVDLFHVPNITQDHIML
ncbi:hypothetical protein Tco_1042449 [Tanacetum coccineum]|uniref:Uncharacterized protein n=1 Tax=Tanacetum coccineum TaxID=301880 RepID=A0ABQ5GKK7_9ASTR